MPSVDQEKAPLWRDVLLAAVVRFSDLIMIDWFPDKRKCEEFRDKVIEDFRDSSYHMYNFMFQIARTNLIM